MAAELDGRKRRRPQRFEDRDLLYSVHRVGDRVEAPAKAFDGDSSDDDGGQTWSEQHIEEGGCSTFIGTVVKDLGDGMYRCKFDADGEEFDLSGHIATCYHVIEDFTGPGRFRVQR